MREMTPEPWAKADWTGYPGRGSEMEGRGSTWGS